MTSFNKFYQQIATNRLSHWLNSLPAHLSHWHNNNLHGEYKHWQKTLDALPTMVQESGTDLINSVRVGNLGDFNDGEFKRLENLMQKFKPWDSQKGEGISF